jgi:hypothetical protein
LSKPVLTTTKAQQLAYPDRITDICDQGRISTKDIIRKIDHGIYLKTMEIKSRLLCFSFKIGLVDDFGEIRKGFIRNVVKKATDEVANICSLDTEVSLDSMEDRNFNYMICLQHNLPISLSML